MVAKPSLPLRRRLRSWTCAARRARGAGCPCGRAPRARRRARGSRVRISSATACCCSRVGFSTRSQRIGSPYWTVTFGNCSRFQLRTCEEPWIATGTTGAPVSSARRPMPRLACSASLPVRERPPSQYIVIAPPRSRIVSAVMNASSSRAPRRTGNTPPWRVDELHRRLEQLRLGHEADLAAHEAAHEEVVHEREVVGREDHRAAAGHVLAGDRARAEERVGVQRCDHAHELVDPVGLARARALVEAVEVLLRARVGVDLLPHRGEIAHHCAVRSAARKVTPAAAQPRPLARASASAQPASSAGALVVAHARLVSRRALAPARARRARRRPSTGRPRRPRGTRRRAPSSRRARPSTTGHAEHVGLELHQPAVRASRRRRRAARAAAAATRPPSRAPRRRSGRRSPRASRARGARARCRASARRSCRARTGPSAASPAR